MPKPLSMPDPDVKIPTAVKASAAHADELFHLSQGNNPDGSDPNAPEGAPEGGDAPQPDQPKPDQPKPDQPKPDQPKPQPSRERGGTEEAKPADWENRYNAMRGRFEASEKTIRDLSQQIAGLHSVLATVQASPSSDQQPPMERKRYVTEQEEADYGAEFLDVVGRRSRQEYDTEIAELKNTVANLQNQVGRVGGHIIMNARERLDNQLDADVPNWRDLNYDPKFLDWLALPDVYSGAIRHELLKAAYARNDTPRVVSFFKGFLSEEAAVDPANYREASQRTNGSGRNGSSQSRPQRASLESFAAPGRARTAASSSTPAEKPLITRPEIAAFYAEVAAGKYRGREDEQNRNEAMIFEAQREGRIR